MSERLSVAEHLEPLLDELVAVHEVLVPLLESHREALRAARRDVIELALQEEARLHGRLAELDERRGAIVGDPRGGKGLTLSAAAKTLPEPARGRALAKAERLRVLAMSARELNSVIERSSRAMLEHLTGVMHKVSQRLSHAGTYGRMGRVECGPAVVSGLDVRQ